ncbi:uncharacterized protein THITE_118802 [Thermothielavioides terrestris NRRL 8126]|uniref:Mid2 domain-containing protein n=1 Tax=Thermothielavioides terrestris (strain ATCC 38088 / NRRL 8126) TaxID=578455 RepID=G2R1Q7_THETT|nr:uncharacterized protein THITE_118802 [Thermothielavioides terrestris NRRL 8126]AEO66599.1 hypothetical protein THITE_118802 [Thermothielavioides terrestris NRRL 8126]
MASVLARLSLLLLAVDLTAGLNRCYYPNTNEATGDFPCDPDAAVSMCCGEGSMCLSNKSCKGPKQNMIRGSCTDQTWESLDCPLYCYLGESVGSSDVNFPSMLPIHANLARNGKVANIGPDLISCSNVTKNPTDFCCDNDAGCCDSGIGRFSLLPSDPQPWATWDGTKSQYVVVKPLSPATAATTGTSTSISTSTSVPATTTTTASLAASTSSSALGAAIAPTLAASPQAGGSPSLSTAAKAGIGVGAAVGAAMLGVIAFLLWKLNQSKKEKVAASASDDG